MFNTYFDGKFVLEKNALFNIVFSDRSDGKTFDCKVRALEDYKNKKQITVYMRRYKTEITKKLYETFFDEVIRIKKYEEYSNWQFRGSKNGVEVKTSLTSEWDFIVYFVPLTMSGKLKSQIDVSRIYTIDFDEYMPLDGKFIKDEITLLLEFWKSIDRDREIVQLMILGNRISPFCPLFDYFNINLRLTNDKLKLYKDGTLAVQIYSNKEHRKKREEGKFRKLISGTPYEDYDTGGILNALNLKSMSRNGADYMCSFKTERGEGSIWYKHGIMIISEYKRLDGYVISDNIYNTGREEYLYNYGKFAQTLKSVYRRGDMYFETEKAFYKFEKIMEKIVSR